MSKGFEDVEEVRGCRGGSRNLKEKNHGNRCNFKDILVLYEHQ